ncbi:MAG: helix-turn-helix domain-containing protein, partial [Planctomycetota bacterium]
MQDILTRRVQNLRVLVGRHGGASSLAKKVQLSGPSYISQILSGVRPLTEKTARKFEAQLGLPMGWLDDEHIEARAGRPPST